MGRIDKSIERLTKRKEWLDKRIEENSSRDLSYDKAESSALEYALEKLIAEKEAKEKSAQE